MTFPIRALGNIFILNKDPDGFVTLTHWGPNKNIRHLTDEVFKWIVFNENSVVDVNSTCPVMNNAFPCGDVFTISFSFVVLELFCLVTQAITNLVADTISGGELKRSIDRKMEPFYWVPFKFHTNQLAHILRDMLLYDFDILRTLIMCVMILWRLHVLTYWDRVTPHICVWLVN